MSRVIANLIISIPWKYLNEKKELDALQSRENEQYLVAIYNLPRFLYINVIHNFYNVYSFFVTFFSLKIEERVYFRKKPICQL